MSGRVGPRPSRGRLAALVLVAAAFGGGGVLGAVSARPAPRTTLQPAALAAEAAPLASTSSSWYCPAGPAGDAGTTHLLVANAAGHPVRAVVQVVDARGTRRDQHLRVGPHAQTDVVPGRLVHGPWVASRVEVSGGAVSATELVDGRRGRALAPCASEVSAHWYFASGSTRGGSTLSATLFNPTPNLAVVDLSFVTGSGLTTPAPFQGLVVRPWTLRTLTVGAYVQNQSSVATVVDARAGAVVAGELELFGPGGTAGVALALGSPATSARWHLPSAENATGGASELSVFNPTRRGERVVVAMRLPAGPVEPFSQMLGPKSVWTLTTSDELRVAVQEPYTVEVQASGPGVVVAQTGAGAPAGPVPWWSADVAVSGPQESASHRWLVAAIPPVTAQATTADVASGARVAHARSSLVIENPAHHAVAVRVTWWSRSGAGHLRRVRVPAAGRTTLAAPAGPAVVAADGPLAVMGDASPTGSAGVFGVPAIPLR
ncbi:MAG TPA: DUF5719 family protein [Acidimicrobiales bacterium]|nr:DUF5719 family protein [Acidimicrobiales bacterium]